ncbi:MAG: VanZ family protein, partial [Planctomycetota bacterium JB042]
MNDAAARLAAVPRPVAALLALSWAAGIFTLSSLPGAAIGAKGFAGAFAFNLAHAPLFGGLATFVGLALLGRPSIPFPDRGRMLGAFVLVLLYGACDEWHQASVA